MKQKDVTRCVIALFIIVVIVFILPLIGCSTKPKVETVATPVVVEKPISTPVPTSTPIVVKPIPNITTPVVKKIYPVLSWEKDHIERKGWTNYLIDQIDRNISTLNKAIDIKKFCTNYDKITSDQKLQAWGELFVWIAYYESSWNPQSSSVDVGSVWDKNTYSIGLFSVSVIDQESYSFKDINYTYKDLLTPNPNIDLAVRLIAFQINKVGTILIGPSRKWLYFATLHPYGKYDESKNIISHVQKLTFCQ